MNEQDLKSSSPASEKEDNLLLLSEIQKSPHLTQRELSLKLNISLGKTNYLIKQLAKKGLLKVKNFSYNPGKLQKVKYYLTKKGLEQKMSLTYLFLKKKEAEYNQIKEEWERLQAERFSVGAGSKPAPKQGGMR